MTPILLGGVGWACLALWSDGRLYRRGMIDTSRPFAELRARSDITARAKAADRDPAFSQRIREGLPPRPGAD